MNSSLKVFAIVIRWGARLLSGLILLFWGFMLVAHLVGDAGRSTRPLMAADYVILSAMVVSLVGLLLAWRWELAGAIITILAVLVGAFVNWRVLIFPGTLIPIAAGLFMSSWLLGRRLSRSAGQAIR